MLGIWRSLLAWPIYSLAAVTTIALTVALSSNVFAVVDATLFKPLPYADSDNLYTLSGVDAAGESGPLSVLDIDYLNQADPRIRVAGFTFEPPVTHPGNHETSIGRAAVTATFFDVLGQHPQIGTLPNPSGGTARPDPRPALLSRHLLEAWGGSERDAIGQVIQLIPTAIIVEGVLPPNFSFPAATLRPTGLIVPFAPTTAARSDRSVRQLSAIARLTGGISFVEAREKLDAALRFHQRDYSSTPKDPGPYVSVRLRAVAEVVGEINRPMFKSAFAAAALLVLIGALNVCVLFTTRLLQRTREVALYLALGSSQLRVTLTLLTEAAVIGLMGGVIGLILAVPTLTVTERVLPEYFDRLEPIRLDLRVASFSIIAATFPLLVLALFPAARASRRSLVTSLQRGATSTRTQNSIGRSCLLFVETASAMVLLVCGVLVANSYFALAGEDIGFVHTDATLIDVRFPSSITLEQRGEAEGRIIRRLKSTHGVSDVALVGVPLFEGMRVGSQFQAVDDNATLALSDVTVSGSFFDVLPMRLVAGRLPTAEELDTGSRVCVLSQGAARALFPQTDAIGKVLVSENGTVLVVGIVEETRLASLRDRNTGEIFLPSMLGRRVRSIFLLRGTEEPRVLARSASAALRADMPNVLIRRAMPVEDVLWQSSRTERFQALLLSTVAVAAAVLVAVGLSGVVFYGAANRKREIAIRLALGASRQRVATRTALGYSAPAFVGVLFGLLVAWWINETVRAYLYQTDPFSPGLWGSAAVLLTGIIFSTSYCVAFRATAATLAATLRET